MDDENYLITLTFDECQTILQMADTALIGIKHQLARKRARGHAAAETYKKCVQSVQSSILNGYDPPKEMGGDLK